MTSYLTPAVLASKFRGCLTGALIGDCLGAPFEGDISVSKTVLGNYFSTLLRGESKQMYTYTDDTAMTVSVANSLIETQKICSVDMAKRFVTEFYKQPQRGYGNNVVTVFDALKVTDFKDVFLPAKMQFNGSGSYGNGAAMRISPIALFSHSKDDQYIKHAVEQCSFVTHTHPNGYNGAILQCYAIQSALKLDSSQTLDPVEFIHQLKTKMEFVETKDKKPYCTSLEKIKQIYLKKKQDISAEEIAEYLGNDVSAEKSVPTAIYAFLRSLKPIPDQENLNSFMRTIYFSISVGGDTDTIASMAGGIAGAYYGYDFIPDIVRGKFELYNEVVKLADDLFNVVKNY